MLSNQNPHDVQHGSQQCIAQSGDAQVLLDRVRTLEGEVDSLRSALKNCVSRAAFDAVVSQLSTYVTTSRLSNTMIAFEANTQASLQQLGKDLNRNVESLFMSCAQDFQKRLQELQKSRPHDVGRTTRDSECRSDLTSECSGTSDSDDAERPPKMVSLRGLVKACHLNGALASVVGYDTGTQRYSVQVLNRNGTHDSPVKVKRTNLRSGRCPDCKGEVTSGACFNCGYGLSDSSRTKGAEVKISNKSGSQVRISASDTLRTKEATVNTAVMDKSSSRADAFPSAFVVQRDE